METYNEIARSGYCWMQKGAARYTLWDSARPFGHALRRSDGTWEIKSPNRAAKGLEESDAVCSLWSEIYGSQEPTP
jgi:hypothetical protein